MDPVYRYLTGIMAPTPPHVFEQPAPAFDVNAVETPAYVVDRGLLKKNLEKLAQVQKDSGAKILLALKGFSMFSTFDLVREYLHHKVRDKPMDNVIDRGYGVATGLRD